MPIPWLTVGKLVVSNLDTIIGVVKPVFTRKDAAAAPDPSALLNQQVAELQAAATANAERIGQLAAQLKEVVAGLEQAAASAAAEHARTRRLAWAGIAMGATALLLSAASLVAR
jgi:hypothetical protein